MELNVYSTTVTTTITTTLTSIVYDNYDAGSVVYETTHPSLLPQSAMPFRTQSICALVALLAVALVAIPTPAEDAPRVDVDSVVGLLELLIDVDPDSASQSLDVLIRGIHNGTLSDGQVAGLKAKAGPMIAPAVADPKSPLHRKALILAASWGDGTALETARAKAIDREAQASLRGELLQALAAGGDPDFLGIAGKLIGDKQESDELKSAAINALSGSSAADAATPILNHYTTLSDDLQAKAIEMLTGRPAWSKALLQRIGAKEIPKTALNANQVAKLQASGDEALRELVAKNWGRVRTERNPERERVVNEMRDMLSTAEGDPVRGREVFHKVCGQCHKMYGKGYEVGPDLTGNGRSSYEQLLSNVFDPSLVIGEAYQARTVLTVEGKVITGLLAEESERQIVLKVQGGKTETIPTDDIDALKISQLSLMPEGLEKQLKPEELADLFSFITLSGQPEDPKSLRIPGSPSFGK